MRARDRLGWARSFAGILLATACSDRLVRLQLPAEILDGTTKSVVVGFEAGSPPSLRAIEIIGDPSAQSVVRTELAESDSPSRVTLLAASATLEQLGLEAGSAPLAPEGTEAQVLFGPIRGFEAKLDPEARDWAPIADPLEAKARIRIQAGLDRTLCEQVQVSTVELELPNQDLYAVAALADGYAVIGGGGTTSGSALGLVSPMLGYEPSELPWAPDSVESLVVGDDGLYGITGAERLFQMDLDTHRIVRTATSTFQRLTLRGDGRLFAWNKIATAELSHELRVVRLRPDFPPVRRMLAIGGEAMLVATSTAIYRIDGDVWTLEQTGFDFSETETALFGDEQAWASDGVGPWQRDLGTGVWRPIPKPTEGIAIRAGVNIAKGTILIGGSRGILSIWNGRTWCSVSSGTFRAITALAIDPGRWIFYAVTWNGGPTSRPSVIRGNLPLLP